MSVAARTGLKSRRFWAVCGLNTFAALGVVATAVELLDFFAPDTVPHGIGAGVVALVAAIGFGLLTARPRPVEQSYASPNLTIRVVRGDLFAQSGHLVINMTDTFDTDTTAGIIAAGSLQGQFLDRVYRGDRARLDAELDRALSGIASTGTVPKLGKTTRFPVGTTVALPPEAGGRRFFCVALTSMNELNEARASIDDVWTSLSALWRAVSAHGNGGPIAMTVIGGGQSRLSQALSQPDAIRLQALSFWLAARQERVSEELRIVVRAEVYDTLDLRELQAFLTSLMPA